MAKKRQEPTTAEMIEELVEEETAEVEALQEEGVEAELVEEPEAKAQFVFAPGRGMMFLAPDEEADWQPIEDCPVELRDEYAIMQAMNRRLVGDGKF